MTDEEKKAIEKLTNAQKIDLIECIRKFKREGIENFVIKGIENFVITRKEFIVTILNLIENQQKEIEILTETNIKLKAKVINNNIENIKKNNEQIEDLNEGWKIELKNYIPKSKIEEKIDELECCLDLCVNDRKISKYKIKALEEEIKDFKELLESED